MWRRGAGLQVIEESAPLRNIIDPVTHEPITPTEARARAEDKIVVRPILRNSRSRGTPLPRARLRKTTL